MPTAVGVEDVSKRFRLFQEKYTSLKERVIHAGKVPYHDLWALSDISFDVEEGQTIGILGRNGSGKSTLLKCLCGVLQPTSGRVVVRGTLAGLLELGAGFQHELSGRDNIYLNGSLLGLSRKEVDRRFEEIVAFAELEQFIDNQVKFYSSGMTIRLGFAVAVNIDPHILVIDEVLAVGDERFQAKCMERIRQFQQEGRTIILVSHSADQVRSVCDRALVLNGGRLMGMGTPGEAVRLYREILLEAGDALPISTHQGPEEAEMGAPPLDDPAEADTGVSRATMAAPGEATTDERHDGHRHDETTSGEAPMVGNRPVRLTKVAAELPGSEGRPYLQAGEPVVIRASYVASAPVPEAMVAVEIRDSRFGSVYRTDTSIMGMVLNLEAGPGAIEFSVGSFPMLEGSYEVSVGLLGHLGGVTYDWRETACRFEVVNASRATGIVGLHLQASLVDAGDAAIDGADPAEQPGQDDDGSNGKSGLLGSSVGLSGMPRLI